MSAKASASGATPCAEPVCSSKKDSLLAMLKSASPAPAAAPCPADREELGRQTWTLLHTLAAHFPEAPSAADREAASTFLRTLGALYPCSHCAEDFRDGLAESPPRCEAAVHRPRCRVRRVEPALRAAGPALVASCACGCARPTTVSIASWARRSFGAISRSSTRAGAPHKRSHAGPPHLGHAAFCHEPRRNGGERCGEGVD